MADDYQEFPCDLCGCHDAVELPHCRDYTNGQLIHICQNCGFVYVKARRAANKIADVWSEEIFGSGYTAAVPGVAARQTFVAEFIASSLGFAGKDVCDIGAGEGNFLQLVRESKYGARVFGIEPSPANCSRLAEINIEHYNGTIEGYLESNGKSAKFDIVTVMWTLENCQSCRAMLAGAHRILKEDGHIVVATGSRILVPFKKPLQDYLSTNPADTHSFRFSANTLRGVLAISGFQPVEINRYIDNDVLCVVARKVSDGREISWEGDYYLDVYNFFERWHVESTMYYGLGSEGKI